MIIPEKEKITIKGNSEESDTVEKTETNKRETNNKKPTAKKTGR